MRSLSINEAKKNLSQLMSDVALDHEPVHIKGDGVSAVLMDEDDWRAVQETLYLLSIPDMRESIREGLDTPLTQCAIKL